MIFLMDCTKEKSEGMEDLGIEIGQLLTPLSRLKRWHDLWAVDNGCYKRFKEKSFLGILARNKKHLAS